MGRKLQELENLGSPVILNEEVFQIIDEEGLDKLTSYEFKNQSLMGRIWENIVHDPGIAEIPQGKLYRYLTQIGYTEKPERYTEYELKKFWNLPNLISDRLFELIGVKEYNKTPKVSHEGIEQLKSIISSWEAKLDPTCKCTRLEELIRSYNSILSEMEVKVERMDKEQSKLNEIDAHKYDISGFPPLEIVKILLTLNGYKGSIYQGKRLEKLIWLATGWRLTDIIQDVTKFIKVRDEVQCTLKPEFISAVQSDFDWIKYGLGERRIYLHYSKLCTKIAEDNGRVPKMYPGYSLSTLKSTIKAPTPKLPKPKVSEYEVLRFVNDNINSNFDWVDIKSFKYWLDRYGIEPALSDEGERYLGFVFKSDKLGDLNRVMLKYDKTDLMAIRKVLVNYFDDSVEVTRLSKSEIQEFDNDLACQMIDLLIEKDTIRYNQLMEDMKWLRVIGHIGINIRKSEKGIYKIFFNTVSFAHVTELIYKSNKGYDTARRVLERLGQTSSFYREVLKNFNEAVWNMHKCQLQLIYE